VLDTTRALNSITLTGRIIGPVEIMASISSVLRARSAAIYAVRVLIRAASIANASPVPVPSFTTDSGIQV
jgi:hypothetical protein